jgi:hypothetical protein
MNLIHSHVWWNAIPEDGAHHGYQRCIRCGETRVFWYPRDG